MDGKSFLNHDQIPNEWKFEPHTKPQSLDYGDNDIWNKVKSVFLNPRFSTLFTKDVSNMPSTFMLTVQYDVFRDEGFWYAERLKEAGNDVIHLHISGGFHGMMNLVDTLPMADNAYQQIKAVLTRLQST